MSPRGRRVIPETWLCHGSDHSRLEGAMRRSRWNGWKRVMLGGVFLSVASPPGAQPVLEVEPVPDALQLRWPDAIGPRVLEEAVEPTATASWTETAAVPELVGAYRQVTIPSPPVPRFWRLRVDDAAAHEPW